MQATAVRNGIILQFKKVGNWYEPKNPDAANVCEIAGTSKLPGSRMSAVRRAFMVEVSC